MATIDTGIMVDSPEWDKMSHFFGIGCIHTDIKPTMMGIVCQGKTNIITI